MTDRLKYAIQGKHRHSLEDGEVSRRKICNRGAGRKFAEHLRNKALSHDSEYFLELSMLYKYIKGCRRYSGKCNAEHVGEIMRNHGWRVKEVDYAWVKAWEEKQTCEVDCSYLYGLKMPIEIVIYKGPNRQELCKNEP